MRTRTLVAAIALMGWAGNAAAQTPGEREYIDSKLSVPTAVINTIGDVLPESGAVNAAYLSGSFDANLLLDEDAEVFVSFMHEGAGYKNSLGYFTYVVENSKIKITSSQLLFPNASYADYNKGWGGGKLATGDTVTLRDAEGAPTVFEQGTRIGFFVVSDGFVSGTVKGWSGPGSLPFTDSAQNAASWGSVFTSIDELNPEMSTGRTDVARHVALVSMKGIAGFLDAEPFVLVGFEDQRRDKGSDNDFNDLVFVVRSNPPEAISTDNVASFDPNDPDPDEDGVEGVSDSYPEDGERAVSVRTPPTSYQTLAFEDSYPTIGDADYNDVVVQYAFEEVYDAAGKLKDLAGTFHLVARGATYDHRFGIALHGVPEGVTGTLRAQRVTSDGTVTTDAATPLSDWLKPDADGKPTIRLDHIFASTLAALPGEFTNTAVSEPDVDPASMRFVLTFDEAIDRSELGAVPFDPFIQVVHGTELYDIHRPGRAAFPDRPAGLPEESGSVTFIDDESYPWAILVPYDWRWPLEKVHIGGHGQNDGAYSRFHTWRASFGWESTDWYTEPRGSGFTIDPIGDAVRVRPWTLNPGR